MPISACSSLQQLQDLRLHRDIERGRRLVGDQQVGIVGERHGDHHALALAAGKLMRKILKPRFGIADADLGQKLDDASGCALAPVTP